MLKLRKIYFLLPLLALLFVFLLPNSVEAAKFEVGNYTLDRNSVVEDDLYISGTNISISGVVDGDLLATGDSVTVDGTVTGNLYVAANTVNINGNVYGNVIVGGSSIVLDGTLGRDVIAAGLTVNSSADISEDLTVLTGTLRANGTVGDDVRVLGGDVISTATVGGDFVFTGQTNSINENDVAGEVVHSVTESSTTNFQSPDINITGFSRVNIGLSLVSFLGMFVVGAVLIFLAPVKTLQIEKNITNSWEDALKSLAVGLLVLFVLPLPLLLLAFTLIGAPLSLLIFGVMFFLTVFGVLWVEVAIGHKVLELLNQKDSHRYLSLLVGRFISVVVKLIPVVGFFYTVILMMLAVGSVVRTKTHAISKARK